MDCNTGVNVLCTCIIAYTNMPVIILNICFKLHNLVLYHIIIRHLYNCYVNHIQNLNMIYIFIHIKQFLCHRMSIWANIVSVTDLVIMIVIMVTISAHNDMGPYHYALLCNFLACRVLACPGATFDV